MVECGALSGETYGVLFVGFLFMIAFSSSARLLLIGIATSIFIVLLTKGRCTSLVLYCKDVHFLKHSLVNVIILSRASIPIDRSPAMPLMNNCNVMMLILRGLSASELI